MDNMVYQSLMSYFNVLEKTGYMSFPQVQKLLVLCFYRDFVFQDYRGILTKYDYHLIEQVLACLYGSTCLIPYPDYLKMSKLHLGEMTELAQRVKTIEDTEVLKAFDGTNEDSDIMIVESDDTSGD